MCIDARISMIILNKEMVIHAMQYTLVNITLCSMRTAPPILCEVHTSNTTQFRCLPPSFPHSAFSIPAQKNTTKHDIIIKTPFSALNLELHLTPLIPGSSADTRLFESTLAPQYLAISCPNFVSAYLQSL